MPTSQYKKLLERAEGLYADRNTTENTWQQIADNELGRRDFTTIRSRGEQRLQHVYDGTSKISGGLLTGSIHSLMTSPAQRWFALGFEDPRLQRDAEAAAWLDLSEKRLYAALAAPAANFHAQLAETYIDLVYFGTGAIFIDDVPGQGVRFSTRPLQEMFLAEDPSGRIDTMVRRFKLSARQAVSLWGDKAVSAGKALGGSSFEDTAEYVHIILPNEDLIEQNIDASGMPWASFILSTTDAAIMSEGGFQELPIATPRWQKDAGEVYGRGPGWDALSDQKMLNEMMKVTLKAGQKAVDPTLMIDSGAVLPGDLVTHPGGTIMVDTIMANMNPPIQPLVSGSNFNISQALIADTRNSVQNAFLKPLVEAVRDPRMTATQTLELSAQMSRHMAPILGRQQTEMAEPILERVFAIEARAGRLPPPPPQIADQPLKIDYVNPIARAQQTSDARAIIDFSGVVTNLSQVAPEVLDIVDWDATTRELGEALGVPPVAMRDARNVAARRAAEQQLAEEAEQERQAVVATDQLAKVAKATQQQGAQ